MRTSLRLHLGGVLAAALAILAIHPGAARAQNIIFTGTQTTINLPPGTYKIEAAGGQGGVGGSFDAPDNGGFGGNGAYVSGNLTLTTATTITVLAGTQGAPSIVQAGGGGGGSYVMIGSTPILIAGGGGGGPGIGGTATGGPGLVTQDGGTGENGGGTGGSGGTAGDGDGGAGGGGLLTGGSNGISASGGSSFTDGGASGIAGGVGGNGGFGGGGGGAGQTDGGGGGGGGYSGGGGGATASAGAGGGSFIASTLTGTNGISGFQQGDGFVRITPPIGTVVASGDPVPGVPDARFISVDNPSLDGMGDFVFKAVIGSVAPKSEKDAKLPAKSNSGIWLYQSGTGSLIAQTGTAAPDGDTDILTGVDDPVMDTAGAYAFEGFLHGIPFVDSTLISRPALWFSQPGGTPQIYAYYSETGADQQEAAYTAFPQIAISQSTGVAFFAKLAGNEVTPQSSLGLFSPDRSGDSSIVTRTGFQLTAEDSSPTIQGITALVPPADVTGQSLSIDTVNGNMAFSIKFTSGLQSIFLATPAASGFNNPIDIADIGDTAIGASQGRWLTLGPPAVNANATVAFLATERPGKNGKESFSPVPGIWVDSGTDTFFQLQALAGWAAPANSGTYGTFSDPVLNNNDNVAFIGTLTGKNKQHGAKNLEPLKNQAVFLMISGTPVLISRLGDIAPGLSDSTAFFSAFQQIVLPDNTGPIILATASSVKNKPVTGLWSSDENGNLSLIIATGQKILVHRSLKEIRTISVFQSVPVVSGESRNFSAADGSVVLMATFSDNTWAVLNTNVITP